MSHAARNTLIGILGLILLVAPMLVRSSFFGSRDTYEPPQIDDHLTAATPIPTMTAVAQQLPSPAKQPELRSGPVVVDLAHFNFLDVTKFQPLSSALAQRGLGTRLWLPVGIDALGITSYLDFPDQSEKLAEQLEDASGLIIISPYFLWSDEEIEVVTDFVADGGRLLLISDPDIMGDLAQTMNILAEPYGVVFNDDYLYNTNRNDENFTYTFQGGYSDRAADLEGSEIVLYGARSIVGSVVEQVRTSDTTLSSSRKGLTNFTTVAIGGLSSTETADRVLAMGDFDVLSEPYVDRYDNVRMLDFVADFMAGGGRTETLVDFPGSLGKEVSLVYGTRDTIDASLITISAKLQQRLERSGRDMLLAQSAALSDGQIISSTGVLTGALAALVFDDITNDTDDVVLDNELESSIENSESETDSESEAQEDGETDRVASTTTIPAPTATPTVMPTVAPEPLPDGNVIYLADFETAADQESLLSDVGFTLIHVARTPTATPTPTEKPTLSATFTATPTTTATATPTAALDIGSGDELTSTLPITGTAPITGTGVITESGLLTGSQSISATVDSVSTVTAEISQSNVITEVGSISDTLSITATGAITDTKSVTATEEPEPIITAYLVSDGGLHLLAAETVLIVQQDRADDDRLVAVLGESAEAINAGVERLLERNFADCVIEDEQAICPFVSKNSGSKSGNSTSSGSSSSNGSSAGNTEANADSSTTPTPTPTPTGDASDSDDDPEDEPTTEPDDQPIAPEDAKIIIVDDNDNAVDAESSEAEYYMSTLTSLGASPALWSVADSGTPPTDLLTSNDWVIWSSGSYANGGPTVADLDPLFEVLNDGGRITISSQNTFFGQTQDPPSPLTDIQITSSVPALTTGLPDTPIALTVDGVSVAPIQANTEENPSLSVVLRRGPTSGDAEEPILFILVDDEVEEATGARLMVLGMSVEWLPPEVSKQLIENTMKWVLE